MAARSREAVGVSGYGYFRLLCNTEPDFSDPNTRPLWIYRISSLDWMLAEILGPDNEEAPIAAGDPWYIDAGAQVIGQWYVDGTIRGGAGTIDDDLYSHIVPLGNNSDGSATGALRAAQYAGTSQFEVGDQESYVPNLRLYPVDNSPLKIEVRHWYFADPLNPQWDSWGWRAEIAEDSWRDVISRAIGIYFDAACTDYWYTTGAFVLGPSEFDPGRMSYSTEYNPAWLGYPSDQRVDVHHAVLFGSAQEGIATLLGSDDAAEHLYWQGKQSPGSPAGAKEWVAAGVEIVQQAGVVYQCSPSWPVDLYPPGTPIRVGEIETVFSGLRDGFDDWIHVEPFVTFVGLPAQVEAYV